MQIDPGGRGHRRELRGIIPRMFRPAAGAPRPSHQRRTSFPGYVAYLLPNSGSVPSPRRFRAAPTSCPAATPAPSSIRPTLLPRAVNNIPLQALVASYAAGKALVNEASARTAVTEEGASLWTG